ncbi:transcription factor IIIB 90 kDa subunit isoform X2 [Toxorhynchites rutilus septentrionalis]|uniref:transcription factor IIIB 90 kDa subunit isoform X2 n=1 Tax=Toxorhynchites rutilus septentrionalis TaxID=329112 RepID=UPI0024789451|nr:transcription factor IIIB 90 kDa subunit isoform X2 [Toxorhynchites rutilus septentrionalis]
MIHPCIYIMRYANKLEFGEKTHEVSMTAQRLVQRMKKDSIHSGRRPSGLCGAALLLAARMHEYSRTPNDIVRIVKIHESTLRKRLVEFGETPSSALTLDEFMSVDLEAEQDPPAFKAARKKDKERLQKLGESNTEFNQLQAEIDAALDRDLHKSLSRKRKLKGEDFGVDEVRETDQFINESTIDVINECLEEDPDNPAAGMTGNRRAKPAVPEGMKPDLIAMCSNNSEQKENNKSETADGDGDLICDDLDDEEINGYIMTEEEARYKDMMWNRLHAEYLKEMKEKEERLAKEREEGKPEKKKRKSVRKKTIGPSSSAGEAIEKMLQEKKISSKINYDILKTLTDSSSVKESQPETSVKNESSEIDILSRTRIKPETALNRSSRPAVNLAIPPRRKPAITATLPVVSSGSEDVKPIIEEPPTPKTEQDHIDDYDDDVDAEPEPEPEHKSLADMLNTGDDDDYYGYEEDY